MNVATNEGRKTTINIYKMCVLPYGTPLCACVQFEIGARKYPASVSYLHSQRCIILICNVSLAGELVLHLHVHRMMRCTDRGVRYVLFFNNCY
jgi:hypothetical protein